MIDVGKLNQRINILSYTEEQNENGFLEKKYIKSCSCWADLKSKVIRTIKDDNQVLSEKIILCVIRYRDIHINDRIEHKNTILKVVDITNIENKNRFLELELRGVES